MSTTFIHSYANVRILRGQQLRQQQQQQLLSWCVGALRTRLGLVVVADVVFLKCVCGCSNFPKCSVCLVSSVEDNSISVFVCLCMWFMPRQKQQQQQQQQHPHQRHQQQQQCSSSTHCKDNNIHSFSFLWSVRKYVYVCGRRLGREFYVKGLWNLKIIQFKMKLLNL